MLFEVFNRRHERSAVIRVQPQRRNRWVRGRLVERHACFCLSVSQVRRLKSTLCGYGKTCRCRLINQPGIDYEKLPDGGAVLWFSR